MKYLIAGGGTAGHINPALAIAGVIKEHQPDADILFVGAPNSMEARLVPAAGYKLTTMEVAGFQRKISRENIKRNMQAVHYLLHSGAKTNEIINDFKPDIAIGTGGYVSGPILRKAASKGVPIVIHEQNAFPGVTTKLLSKSARCVMLAVEDTKKHLGDGISWEITGNPLRSDIFKYDRKAARAELGLSDSEQLVVSFGGSLGARAINEGVIDFIVKNAKTKMCRHIHAYGQYGKWLPEEIEKKGGIKLADYPFIDIREYINDMPRVMAAADLVICRSGAITLSELQAQGKASILIPSPNVAENHQYHNAMALVNRGAAKI
ncbi:MAG: UDP-N-acetylglucosamine--N-acetylmuramyl-(pentapeptide) pyrophosphoryl-undecaprenol N-acetylglucosamine transferase, partial [Clostridia bacterium]|nr:UDP-N-acetylglucosamine--N-acetylmuramyl-(pentapeptide) pyrophosphoryl-undecaprenol N-acetylglucosamine transferase [Clostridia bacterium]